MQIGLFSEEDPTIEKLHTGSSMPATNQWDKHHEIYLSNICRGYHVKWKTIFRQPLK